MMKLKSVQLLYRGDSKSPLTDIDFIIDTADNKHMSTVKQQKKHKELKKKKNTCTIIAQSSCIQLKLPEFFSSKILLHIHSVKQD